MGEARVDNNKQYMAGIRRKAPKGMPRMDGYGRKATAKRMARYAANEREANRKPRVKRNGIEINSK